nr:hypothetical protein Syn8016DRAFT_0791 [Synechococcus sp. WH 8016]
MSGHIGQLVMMKGRIDKFFKQENGKFTILFTEIDVVLWDERNLPKPQQTLMPIDHLWQTDITISDRQFALAVGDLWGGVGHIYPYTRTNQERSYNVVTTPSITASRYISTSLMQMFNAIINCENTKSDYATMVHAMDRIRTNCLAGSFNTPQGNKTLINPIFHTKNELNTILNQIERKVHHFVKSGNLQSLSKYIDQIAFHMERGYLFFQ